MCKAIGTQTWPWFVLTLPAVLGGAFEDVTQRLSVLYRLGLTALSAALACYLLGISLSRLGIPVVDDLLFAMPWLGIALAVFAICGLPHAFNIIDGYNGLAGTVAAMICLAIAHVALQLGDRQLAAVVVCLAAATAGFLVWNYPRGLIFAGDGGAYLWGVVIAVASIVLVQRHTSCITVVSHVIADIPGVGDFVFYLPQNSARRVARRGGCFAFSPIDLPPFGAWCFS